MFRPTVLAVAILLGLTGVVMAGPALAQDDTHTVSDGESIQNAIDDASPGDTIRIESGTYREQIDVTVPNVTLVGVGDNPVIEGTRSNTSVVTVTAPGVTLDSLTVTGGEGIGVIDEQNRTVSETGDGIKADGADGLRIVDSRVTGNDGWGINVRRSPNTVVADSTLTNNVWDGVIVVSSNGSVVRDNEASDNGIEEGLRRRHGIRFTNTSHGLIAGNAATGNAYGGILFTNPTTNNTVRNNEMRANGNRGFGTFGAFRDNRVVNNTIADNANFGVLTYAPGGNNTFADNLVRGNGGTGISVDDTDDNTVRNNTVTDSYIGITARQATGTTIANNTVRDGDFAGVSVSKSVRVLVDGNTVTESGLGLRVIDDTTALVVADNTIADNEHGVAAGVPASDGVVVGYNDIVDNEGYGAVVYRGSYHRSNSSFSTVPAATPDIADLNATHNYWGADRPTMTAPDGDASNTVSPNVAVQPVTEASTSAPRSLTRRGQADGGGDEGSSENGGDDSGSDEGDDADDGSNERSDDGTSDDSDTGDDGSDDPADDGGSGEESDDSTSDGQSNDGSTDGEESTAGDGDTGGGSASDSGPGFGAVAAVVALTAAAVVARRRD